MRTAAVGGLNQSITINLPYRDAVHKSGSVGLLLEGIRRGPGSFAIRVFLEQPDANATTRVEGNRHYAGTVYLYGHGQADLANEAYPERAARQRLPYDQFIDITESLGRVETQGDTIAVTLVPVDLQGQPVSPSLLDFRRLAVVSGD